MSSKTAAFQLNIVLIFIAISRLCFAEKVQAQEKSDKIRMPFSIFNQQLKKQSSVSDALNTRILLKKMGRKKLTLSQWNEIRKYLILNPQVGYDLIYKWELVRPESAMISEREKRFNMNVELADELMAQEKFEEAFRLYQQSALFLKAEIIKGHRENLFLYSVMVHQMGRSLFGAGRFDDALEVYTWLPKNYPRLRQALYEKMWVAFQAGRIDLALGAIASQESAYFGNFLDPETYLLKIYIFKKLCRFDDLQNLLKSIEKLKSDVDKAEKRPEGSSFFNDWIQSDIEILSLSRLIQPDPSKGASEEVTKIERVRESQNIRTLLQKRFFQDLLRLKKGLDQIIAYSHIAMGSTDFKFVKHEEIDHSRLMENGFEVWAVNDAEEWIDEIGGHLFIGESLCRKAMTPPR